MNMASNEENDWHTVERIQKLLPDGEVSWNVDSADIASSGFEGIVVRVTETSIEVRLPTMVWQGGAYDPVVTTRPWRTLPMAELTDDALSKVFEEGKMTRKEKFVPCRFCGVPTPPEHRFGEDVCHGCASKHFGIVY
jgi:hypothetical protein